MASGALEALFARVQPAPLTALNGEFVERSIEVDRVANLPRRAPPSDELTDLLTAHLSLRPGVRLRPAQAVALRELYEQRGLFAPMPCGSGKTLVTLLAPTLLGSERPVLVIPAALREKTRRDFAELRADWRVRLPRLVSYEELGSSKNEDLLFRLAPDLLVLDEAHRARNLGGSGAARRVHRYVVRAQPIYAVLSGTLITDQLLDYHHLCVGSLHERAPVPLRPVDAERWAQAVDTGKIGLGALADLPGGFHAHLRESAGVVHVPVDGCPAALEFERWRPDVPPALRTVIEHVELTGLRPDAEWLTEWEVPAVLQQLVLGFYYVWDPLPPAWWLDPRRAWGQYVREIHGERIEGLDTEGQIAQALDGTGVRVPSAAQGRHVLAAWRAVRPAFKPNKVPVWLDGSILEQAAALVQTGWLAWCKYEAAGERLAGLLGGRYYGGGTNPEPLVGRPCVLSLDAHGTGRNLQAWHTSLFLHAPRKAHLWEQAIARTHREGQTADLVRVLLPDVIEYHRETIRRAKTQARKVAHDSGFGQKLLDGTWVGE